MLCLALCTNWRDMWIRDNGTVAQKGQHKQKKENANKKEHIIKEIKKTQTKKNTSPNKKRKTSNIVCAFR